MGDGWTSGDVYVAIEWLEQIASNTGMYTLQLNQVVNRLGDIRTAVQATQADVASLEARMAVVESHQIQESGGISYLSVLAFGVWMLVGWILYGEFTRKTGIDAPNMLEGPSR